MKVIFSVASLLALAVQVSAGAVWVSNQTCQKLTAQITNTSGGSAAEHTVPPKGEYYENNAINSWSRNGPETITVRLGNKVKTFTVQPNQHVLVFIDRIQILKHVPQNI
ncbi:hypothetical protein HGRIS_014806 [Hohenbuehelia grisea]|uniref:DUF2845 domain-containing protein n=1 Tax=Hohenbuehelia grisea TaxID=104357 RepID=A0ABR3IQT0_9AGAR